MRFFSFQRLNICAALTALLMLVAVPVCMIARLSWMAYLLLGLGAVLFFLLFLAYQRKVSSFFDAVNENMDQMFTTRREVELPEGEDTENVFSRFTEKLTRLYNALRIAEDHAKEEKQIMQGMIADLSHQIKTPVANIKMDLELLSARQMPREKQQEFLERTLHQADKMDFLIQSIIKMSRLEMGAIQIIPQNTDFAQTLANALIGVSEAAEKKKIAISVECPQPLMLCHDPKWTEEAIFNLMENAVKYTPQKGSIDIKVELRESGAYLTIADTGIGISEKLQGAVFSKFFRAPEVHNLPGAGVGLYLTRQILEAQGFYITVHSVCGKGSTFAVQFF